MELGDEVSIKIKSAIRAKLKELGIVWDRELPDYVMVLIANKKSKEQMEQDLMIFLGSHTAGFTTWLHNVLRKLEECTISRGLTKKKEEDKKLKPKRKPSDENHQETKKLKSFDVKLDNNSPGFAASDDEGVNRLSAVRIDEGLDSDVSDKSVPTVLTSEREISSMDLLHSRTNGRIDGSARTTFSQERNGLHSEEKTKPKEKIEINWNNEKNSKGDSWFRGRRGSTPRTETRMRRSRSNSRNRNFSILNYQERRPSTALDRGMKENLRRGEECQDYRESSSFFRRRNPEKERNDYSSKTRKEKSSKEKSQSMGKRSSSHESMDRLPSLVKVTPRPVRPPSMQPPSNLILKAVAEAQKSIATSSLPQPDDKFQKKEEKDITSRKSVFRRKIHPAFPRENISITLLNDRVIADELREEHDEPLFEDIRKEDDELENGPKVERFTISLHSDDNDSLIASDFEEANDHKTLDDENYSTDQTIDHMEEPMDISSTTVVEDSVDELPGQRFDRRRLGPRVIPDPNTVRNCLAPIDDSIRKTIVNENAYGTSVPIKPDENGKVIKCKFWPSCDSGNDCRFYHPKEYCRTLPNCKFGQKCLYYHPPCKFADKCLNVTCPYTHTPVSTTSTTKAQAWTKVPLAPSNGQICMYYPNCTKPFCPYQHSYSLSAGIPCKFGINCTKNNCEYDHTQQASKNPYKWVAQHPE